MDDLFGTLYEEKNNDLVFNQEDHSYYYKGEKVMNVTTLLSRVGLGIKEGFKNEAIIKASERGTKVHEIIKLDLQDGIEYKDQELIGYYKAFKRFINDYNIEVIYSEKKLCKELYGVMVAGTCDFKCKLNGIKYFIDWKTSQSIEKHHAYQIEMYYLLDDDNDKDVRRAVVQLKENGKYILMETKDIVPKCDTQIESIMDAYKNGLEFSEKTKIEKNEDDVKYSEIKKRIDEDTKELKKISERIGQRLVGGTCYNEYLEITYRKPAIKEDFNLKAFINSIANDSLYLKSDILELVENATDIKLSASSVAIKVKKE